MTEAERVTAPETSENTGPVQTVIYWITQGYSVILMVMFIIDFLTKGIKSVPEQAVYGFFGFLLCYTGGKEGKRWLQNKENIVSPMAIKGLIFVTIWAVLYIALMFLAFLLSTSGYLMPKTLMMTALGVASIFTTGKLSKLVYSKFSGRVVSASGMAGKTISRIAGKFEANTTEKVSAIQDVTSVNQGAKGADDNDSREYNNPKEAEDKAMILELLKANPGGLGPKDIQNQLELSENTTDRRLKKLLSEAKVEKTGENNYIKYKIKSD
jgi:hypothetical protein